MRNVQDLSNDELLYVVSCWVNDFLFIFTDEQVHDLYNLADDLSLDRFTTDLREKYISFILKHMCIDGNFYRCSKLPCDFYKYKGLVQEV